MVDITAITDFVLGSNNAQPTTNGYIIYGMAVSTQAVDTAIEMARRNLLSIVGNSYYEPALQTQYESYIVDMACFRIAVVLLGQAIPTHFNYKTTDLSISKNANPSIEEMLRRYEQSISQWTKLVLSKNYTNVINQDDLALEKIIEYNGVTYIGRDADPMSLMGRGY